MSNATNCRACGNDFTSSNLENELRSKLAPIVAGRTFSLPSPTLCVDCRMQRRLVWRNELNLFRGLDFLSGKSILTFIPPVTKARVIEVEQWHSDAWNELDYGQAFDPTRPFFAQFQELLAKVPLIALANIRCDNSNYANCAAECRNCYLIGGANHCEDCLYGNYINRSKNCIDNNFIDGCELCYECIDCKDCYQLHYAQNCVGCSESKFLYQCRQVTHCFGCVNLSQARYCFFNQQLSEAEYFTRLKDMDLTSRAAVALLQQRFDAFRQGFPHRAFQGERLEQVFGSSINSSRNCQNCFDATDLDECCNCTWLHKARSCLDIFSWGMSAELCYECLEVGDDSYRTLFSSTTWSSSEILYCYLTKSSKNCFGSVGLRNKQYCILNRQYSRTEYEALVPQIIEHMRVLGEWGEFFPMSVSPHAYNTSISADYFPISKEQALQHGAHWYEAVDAGSAPRESAPDVVPDAATFSIDSVYSCSTSGKAFRFVASEIAFYQAQKLPLPDLCFIERHRRRLKRRAPRKVWPRICSSCKSQVHSTFAPKQPERILCENCFAQALSGT
jgi:hypothetical protein